MKQIKIVVPRPINTQERCCYIYPSGEDGLEAIDTVYGAISTDDLGFELMHEHVMVSGSSIWSQYSDLLDPDRAARVVVRLKEAQAEGVATIVDATTFDLERETELLSRVTSASGVNIINATGQ